MDSKSSSRSAMEVLIGIIAGANNKHDRLGLSYMSERQRVEFGDSYPTTMRLLGTNHEGLNAEVAFFLAVRMFWASIPSQLFSSMLPNYEEFARESLISLGLPSSSAQKLAVVFKRLRSAARSGRMSTQLDLDKTIHSRLFEQQGRRCALCSYRFTALDQIYQIEDDDEFYVFEHNAADDEIFLGKYHRRPVLDHIIPYYLGGDSTDNWQILCQTCNLGKGESLSWLARRGWAPASKISDLLALSPSLRYAVIADFRARANTAIATDEIRIFKKDKNKLIYYDNLECRA